jgi:hypothetical protein
MGFLLCLAGSFPADIYAAGPSGFSFASPNVWIGFIYLALLCLLMAAFVLYGRVTSLRNSSRKHYDAGKQKLRDHIRKLSSSQVSFLLQRKKSRTPGKTGIYQCRFGANCRKTG